MSNSFKKYYTLDSANQGVHMPVLDATGKETGDWINVLGIDSLAFRKANQLMRRKHLAYLEEHGIEGKEKEAYADLIVDSTRAMQAALVTDWSFEEPCTPANVLELFANAPYIAEQVDIHASKRGLFVKG